jgi:hypothetical protein
MMDDRIGTMGSTQGVNDSSSPASANAAAEAVEDAVRGLAVLRRVGRTAHSGTTTQGVDPLHLDRPHRPRLAGDLQVVELRWVAQALLCATLVRHHHRELSWGRRDWQRHLQAVVVDLDILLESFVVLDHPRRKDRRRQLDLSAQRPNLEPLAVEVIAGGDLVVQHQRAPVGDPGRETEGLVGVQKGLGGPGCGQDPPQTHHHPCAKLFHCASLPDLGQSTAAKGHDTCLHTVVHLAACFFVETT